MAKFVFELGTLLEQRERVERARQLAVAECELRRVDLEESIRAINRRRSAAARSLRDRLAPAGGGTTLVAVESVRLDANAALHDGLNIQRAAIELSGVYQKLQAARVALLQAVVARKAVEALKTRRFEAWRAEQKRREDRELDDLMVMRSRLKGEAL